MGIPKDQTPLPADLPSDATMSLDPRHSLLTAGPTAPNSMLNIELATWSLANGNGNGNGAHHTERSAAVYDVERLIGRGGFGEVFEARQSSLRRSIAIKRLRQDLVEGENVQPESASALTRDFELEALTTASLDHPNIVPVHDLGRDAEGRPVLAMKLVRGEPWSALVKGDFADLSAEDFLARHIPILIDVVQAVAFAHSRGIVHRDLKLSQVMVGQFGEVMLMDWGLAIAVDPTRRASRASTDSRLPDEMTEIHDSLPSTKTATNPAGTPAYMAPEQCLSTPDMLGAWTDIYLLGGVLYHLLTGKPPHHAATSDDAFRKASNSEFCDPTEDSGGRRIPEELRELVIESTRRNPNQRTATAEAFLTRLQDFVSGSSRRRESVLISNDVEEALEGGLATDYGSYAEVLSKLNRARELWPLNPDITPLREAALTGYVRQAINHGDLVLAKTQAERLDDENAERATLLAMIDEKELQSQRRTKQFRFAVAAAFALLVVVLLGGSLFTNQVLAERREKTEALADAQRQRDEAQEQRGLANAARADAEDLLGFMVDDMRQSLVPLKRLDLLDSVATAALGYYGEQVDRVESPEDIVRLGDGFSKIAKLQATQGNPIDAIESRTRAIELYRAAFEAAPDDWDIGYTLGDALISRAATLASIGENEAATTDLKEVEELVDEAFQVLPEVYRWTGLKSRLKFLLSIQAGRVGNTEEAHSYMEEAYELRKQLLELAPDDETNLRQSSMLANSLSNKLLVMGKLEEAEVYASESLAYVAHLQEVSPDSWGTRRSLTQAYEFSADILLDRGKNDEAIAMYRHAVESGLEGVEKFPDQFILVGYVMRAYDALADALRQSGKTEEALETSVAASEIAASAVERDPNSLSLERSYYTSLFRLCQLHKELGNLDEALEIGYDALEKFVGLLDRAPDRDIALRDVFMMQSQIAEIQYKQGRFEESLRAFKEMLVSVEELRSADMTDIGSHSDVLICLYSCSGLSALLGYAEDTFQYVDRARQILADLPENNEGAENLRLMFEPMLFQSEAIAFASLGREDDTFERLYSMLDYELPPTALAEVESSPDFDDIREKYPDRFAQFVEDLREAMK